MIKPFTNTYQTLNQITINASNLKHNYSYFSKHNPQAQIAPVLKSNAYGHGLVEVGKWVDEHLSAPFICVDSLYEAYELYKAKIKTPILIIGYTDPQNFKVWKKLPFSWPVFDATTTQALNQHQPGAKIHIKIDTGMCRLGLQISQINSFINQLKTLKQLKIEGIYTHLSQADDPQASKFTQDQIKNFKQAIKIFESRGYQLKWKHIAATSASTPTIYHSEIDSGSPEHIKNPNQILDPDFNLIRLGLGFYGYSPFGIDTSLKPALSLTSRIAQIKTIEEGSQVGYGGTWTAKKPTAIASLPIGYNDGVDRRLSNKVICYYHNTPCPVLGRVSMNITIIDISGIKNPRVGDTVEIIGTDLSKKNHAYHQAKLCDTVPYDLLVGLTDSTKRSIE